MKLWLLVMRHQDGPDETVSGTKHPVARAGEKEREIWEACWFAWERLLRNSDLLSTVRSAFSSFLLPA
jgi:hypothetical protein